MKEKQHKEKQKRIEKESKINHFYCNTYANFFSFIYYLFFILRYFNILIFIMPAKNNVNLHLDKSVLNFFNLRSSLVLYNFKFFITYYYKHTSFFAPFYDLFFLLMHMLFFYCLLIL